MQGPLEPVADALAAMDEVDYVVVTAGSFDLLVEVGLRERRAPARADLRADPHASTAVASTETFVYLKLRKQTYSWGVR